MTKYFFLLFGWLFLVLAVLGVFLPLLPTTPFLLLTLACFMKSSPRMAQYLLEHPQFGSIITHWQKNRAVDKHVKRRANLFILSSFALSIVLVPALWQKILLLVLMIALLVWFHCLPEPTKVAHTSENP